MAKNWYASSIEKLDDNNYCSYKKGNGLYFKFEKVTDENFSFWEQYARNQAKLCESVYRLPTLSALKTVTDSFRVALKFHDQLNTDVWVAYVTDITDNEKQDFSPKLEGDIQMCVTVSTQEGSPFTTHLGVFRAYEFSIVEILSAYKQKLQKNSLKNSSKISRIDELIEQYEDIVPKKGLSLDLHSFAGKAANTIYGERIEYMITKPTENMLEIFQKHLKEAVVVHGAEFEWGGKYGPCPYFWHNLHLNQSFNSVVVINLNKLAEFGALDGYDPLGLVNLNFEMKYSEAPIGLKLEQPDITKNKDELDVKSSGALLENTEQ
jgi:hypothetical protein